MDIISAILLISSVGIKIMIDPKAIIPLNIFQNVAVISLFEICCMFRGKSKHQMSSPEGSYRIFG